MPAHDEGDHEGLGVGQVPHVPQLAVARLKHRLRRARGRTAGGRGAGVRGRLGAGGDKTSAGQVRSDRENRIGDSDRRLGWVARIGPSDWRLG